MELATRYSPFKPLTATPPPKGDATGATDFVPLLEVDKAGSARDRLATLFMEEEFADVHLV